MYDIYLASGATVLTAGLLTSAYMIYTMKKSSVARKTKNLAAVSLSETLVSIAIGAFYIYSYATINSNSSLRAAFVEGKYFLQNIRSPKNLLEILDYYLLCLDYYRNSRLFFFIFAFIFPEMLIYKPFV